MRENKWNHEAAGLQLSIAFSDSLELRFSVFERLETWWSPKHEFLKLLL